MTASLTMVAAAGWGGNPPSAAIYINVNPELNDGKTPYKLTVKDVPVDGFWSVSVYNKAGYFEANSFNAYSINNKTGIKNADGSMADGKDVFILNEESRSFMLILTEQLDDKLAELVNPIDTLPRKQKFSADYGSGKNNLVSVRDAAKPDRFIFFIHFEIFCLTKVIKKYF